MPEAHEELLNGVRIVEWGGGLAAAVAGWFLSCLGAEVTRLEGPSAAALAARGRDLDLVLNRRKQRISIDEEEAPAVLAAAAERDVLLEDQRAANDLARQATDANLQLVAVSMTPNGRTGPRSQLPGSDLTACALSGLSWGLGELEREPLPLPYDLPSVEAGFWGAAGALVALLEKQGSGRGQWVDVAAADVLVFYAVAHALLYTSYGRRWERGGTLMGFGGEPLPCQDGLVSLVAASGKQWTKIAELVSADVEEARTPEFTDFLQAMRNRKKTFAFLREWTSRYTKDELSQAGFKAEIPLAPVLSLVEALHHPALRELFDEISDGPLTTKAPRVPLLVAAETEDSEVPSPHVAAGRNAPLGGLRVVELAWNWTGPMIGQFLADFGAEVIRVESRRRLEPLRRMPPPMRRDGTVPEGDRADLNPYFHNVNRGKLSVTIDFGTPDGAAAVRKLIEISDVVIENMGPGVIERAGFAYEEIRKINPRAIMISAPMLPPGNPYESIRGYAPITSSFGGLESLVGYASEPPTGMTKLGFADPNAGIQAIVGLLAALFRRHHDGRGRHIIVSQVAAVLSALPEPVARAVAGSHTGPIGAQHLHHTPHGHFEAADGGWVAVAVLDDNEWRGLADLLGAPNLDDPELRNSAGRMQRHGDIEARVQEWVAARKAEDAVAGLLQAGIPAARLADLDTVLEDQHFRERGIVLDWDHHLFGPEILLGSPARLSATPPEIRRSAPDVGQDDDYVLGDLLSIDLSQRGPVGP